MVDEGGQKNEKWAIQKKMEGESRGGSHEGMTRNEKKERKRIREEKKTTVKSKRSKGKEKVREMKRLKEREVLYLEDGIVFKQTLEFG